MEGKKAIYFEMLGSFSCQEIGNGTIKNGMMPGRIGKKALSFLQYLIVHHGRNVSSEELMEQFWTEESSSDPAGALRTMLFKVRSLLKQIFPGQEDLLLTLPGCYTWNRDIYFKLDTEEFEEACLEARKKTGEESLKFLLKAISLYKGDFLSANDSEWAMVLRQYYRTLYLDACREALPLLEKKELWMDMVSICEQAVRIDFTMEDFVVYQMRALIAMGQPEQAIEKYETFRDRILRELEIPPTDRVEQIYILASGLRKKAMGIQDIFKLVCEGKPGQQAFFCTFEIFQSIVALEKRHMARSGQDSSIAIISLGREVVPATDARRLEHILLEGLRGGDPVARLEAGSYILMLTGASMGDARLVLGRLEYSFHKTYRRSKASLTYHVATLSSEKA